MTHIIGLHKKCLLFAVTSPAQPQLLLPPTVAETSAFTTPMLKPPVAVALAETVDPPFQEFVLLSSLHACMQVCTVGVGLYETGNSASLRMAVPLLLTSQVVARHASTAICTYRRHLRVRRESILLAESHVGLHGLRHCLACNISGSVIII